MTDEKADANPLRAKFDIAGQRFGCLVAIKQMSPGRKGGVYWLCRCDCSARVVVRGYDLRKGLTKSCGHLRGVNDRAITVGR